MTDETPPPVSDERLDQVIGMAIGRDTKRCLLELRAIRRDRVAPLDPEAMGRAVLGVQECADNYIDGYEMRGEDDQGRDTCYSPNDQEGMLIRDAINGLIADEDFVTAVGVEYLERQKLRAAEGHCLECGCPGGEHYVKCSTSRHRPNGS